MYEQLRSSGHHGKPEPGVGKARPTTRLRRGLRRFAHACGGNAMIEFAIVGPAFLLLLIGIFETAAISFVTAHIETTVQDSGRQIRTGAVQAAADPLATFETLLCDQLEPIVTCDARLIIDVRPLPGFDVAGSPPFFDANGNPQNNIFDPGAAGDVILVRVAYNWQISTPLLGAMFGEFGSTRKILSGAAAFRNEPFNGRLQ